MATFTRLPEILAANYAQVKFNPNNGNVLLQDDGQGVYIARWDARAIGAPQPTDQDIATMTANYVPPPDPIYVAYRQLRALFTPTENTAIDAAGQTNRAVFSWLLQMAGMFRINLGDPLTSSGLDALISAGVLDPARKPVILSNTPPS